MLLKLHTPPPSPDVTKPDRLYNHLQDTLEDLPNTLPKYDKSELLANLIFLLRSPLFLYAIAPRLARANKALDSPSHSCPATPESTTSRYIKKRRNSTIDITNLRLLIKWNNSSDWTTQLLYGKEILLEGQHCNTTQAAGFTQSFHWFCEEARFLRREYAAREHAGAVRLGTARDVESVDVRGEGVGQTQAAARGKKKQRRIVKLKIRCAMRQGRLARV